MIVLSQPAPKLTSTRVVALLATLLSLVVGVVVATESNLLIGAIAGMLLAIVASHFPRLLLWSSIVGCLVIAGTFRLYVPELQFISWIVVGTSSLLLFYIVGDWLKQQTTRDHVATPALIYLALLFILLATVSIAINRGAPGTTISGLKGYFQIWPLMFVLAMVRWDEKTMRGIPKAILWIALLQAPIVLHQYFILVPQRTGLGYGIVPVDVVAGTLGADMYGGGNNATLSLLLIFAWTGILSFWKYKLVTNGMFWAASILLLFPLFLNESKVSLFYLIIAFVSLNREDIARRPHVFLLGLLSLSALLIALLASYVAIHANEGNVSMSTYIEQTMDENVGDKRNRWSMYLNRYSVYGFWAEHHGQDGLVNAVVGHGLAQSKESSGAIPISSVATNRYPGFGIGLTGLSSMLWDVGVLGVGVILAMFWWGWWASRKIARACSDDYNIVAVFRSIEAIIPVFVLSLAHKNSFVIDLPYQALLLGTLGYVAYWWRVPRLKQLYG